MTASPTAGADTEVDGIAVLDQLPVAAAVVDAVGQLVWVNQTTQRLFGYSSDELVGTNILDYIDVEWNPMVLDSIVYALDNPGVRLPTLYRIRVKGGGTRIVEVTANNQLENPAISGLVVLLRVWEEQQLHDEILETLGRGAPVDETFRQLVALAGEDTLHAVASVYRTVEPGAPLVRSATAAGAPVISPIGSGASAAAAGAPWTQAATTGLPVWAATLEELHPAIGDPAASAGFEACWAYPVLRQGSTDVVAVLVFWRDTPGLPEPTADWLAKRMVQLASLALSQAEQSAQLHHAAHFDQLTDLPNRARFFTVLDDHLAAAEQRIGVLYLDLDGFKQVNDHHGHASGDEVLEEVATRLICATRPTDLVARLGGDEFAILCPGATDEGLVATAERLIASINDPVDRDEAVFHVGASVGIAVAEPDTCTADVLVDRADTALLVAKAEGKGIYRFG